ncbi:MAG: hypothetical protein PHE33_04375 [Bacteroidales bacterium]|nr:hypothetical protein [Bacteroidales bacterium]
MTKKTIQKPENWQDFETLCKKLWGEIFEIPYEIKKNGKSGQAQHGVDISGKPKGEDKYVGIQCKSKDDYTDFKLTKSEIDTEIEKAKNFKPLLGTLIFATSANKDSKLEEYVRLKNEESEFKVLLFCWEDIADLIEENKNTHDWYVKNLMHKTKFDFRVLFNNFQNSIVLNPRLEKKITKYVYVEKTTEQILDEFRKKFDESRKQFDEIQKSLEETKEIKSSTFNIPQLFELDTINKSWVDFEVILENSGSEVLEDWFFTLTFKSGVQLLDDESTGSYMCNVSMANINRHDPRYINKEAKSISYNPVDKTVLVQKDYRHFKISVLVEKDAKEVLFDWELIARDYSKRGVEKIAIEPTYELIKVEEEVISKENEREEVKTDYYKVKK